MPERQPTSRPLMSRQADCYPLPSSMCDERGRPRFAFVTFLVMNETYLAGALCVAGGMRRQHSGADSVCLVTPEIGSAARDALAELYRRVIEVPRLHIAHRRAQRRQHVCYVFTRLHALRLEEYERVLLLDADVLPLRHFDHLFTLRPPAGIPNERKAHFVQLDERGGQIWPPELAREGRWIWHRVYASVCRHGERIPPEVTDRVLVDPTNLGINGSLILVEPSETEFSAILADLERPEVRRRVTDLWDWPDQQYLTARWSGSWTCIDARFSGLGGYPALSELCGTHYAGVKPWHFRRPESLRRYARYEDFQAWYETFGALVRDEFPRLQNNRAVRTILRRIEDIRGAAARREGGKSP